VKVSICKQSGNLATPFCPLSSVKEVVYLIKTETSPTDDTPYIYPTNEKADPCPIHSEGSIAPPIGEDDVTLPEENTEEDTTDPVEEENNDESPEEIDPGTDDTTVEPTTIPEVIIP
jgi:penicillin-binding protein 1A